ncbi:MAG: fumarate hydratase [Deltaproteobacteria bacterium]|jgi:fumarate hydratase subunit alpha|nr:fumarate hydratase [Deltaproteobacteria bacterium]
MREVATAQIAKRVKELFLETAKVLPEKVQKDLLLALKNELSPQGQNVLKILAENMNLAAQENLPLCQDCGLPQVRLKIGENVKLSGQFVVDAVEQALREAYSLGYLRQSGCHPLTRENLREKIPVSCETVFVKGDQVEIFTLAKGGGCDNRSQLFNLPPTTDPREVKQAIVDRVLAAGPDACPPFYLGICVGGSFESAPRYAREALLDILWGEPPQGLEEEIRQELITALNASGLGPMCVGGKVTVLDLRVCIKPTHLASLPVAINLSCHSFRAGHEVI